MLLTESPPHPIPSAPENELDGPRPLGESLAAIMARLRRGEPRPPDDAWTVQLFGRFVSASGRGAVEVADELSRCVAKRGFSVQAVGGEVPDDHAGAVDVFRRYVATIRSDQADLAAQLRSELLACGFSADPCKPLPEYA